MTRANRLIRGAILASALSLVATLLAGCETTSAVVGASQKGLGALSCGEIYNTFQAYDRDKISIDAAKQLSSSLGVPYTGGSGASYFDTIKATANVALAAQGCNPL